MVEIAGIEALCRQCAGSGQVLMLSRQIQVRSVMPRWNFGPTQRDVSEFLLSLLALRSEALFQWEARQIRRDNMVVTDLGGRVLFVEVPGLDFWTPTQAFAAWSQAESIRAFSRAGSVLVAQIGRYINGRKDTSMVDLTSEVLVPVFNGGVSIEWHAYTYTVKAAVIHLGARPAAGHYRALLRDGQQRGYSDDGVCAHVVGLSEEHQRNVYTLFLIRSTQE